MRVIGLIVGMLLTVLGLILSIGLLAYILKEHDSSGYYGFCFLIPLIILGGILIVNYLKSNQDTFPESKDIKIEHSKLLNDFLSFYIETKVDGIVTYETVIDYGDFKYEIVNLETQETIKVSFIPGKNDSALEWQIKTYVDKLIRDSYSSAL